MRSTRSLRVVGVVLALTIATVEAAPGEGFPEPTASALASIITRYGSGSRDYRSSAPPVAVFDWDNTVAYNDSSEMVFDRALRRLDLPIGSDLGPLLPERLGSRERRAPILESLREARAGSKPAAEAFRLEMHRLYRDLGAASGSDVQYRWFSKLFAGRSEDELAALADEAIAEACDEPLAEDRLATGDGDDAIEVERGLRIYRPVAKLIESLRAAGWDVWILSAGVEPVIRRFAARIGVPGDRVIGVRFASSSKGGKLLPSFVEPFPYAAGKVKTIERVIRREPRLVAGDSSGDLPMLRRASGGRLVIARDESSASVKAARAEGWLVVTPAELAARSSSPGDCFFGGAP